jgi:two-component system response regulator GlrR
VRLARTSPIEFSSAKEGQLLRLADKFPSGALGSPTPPAELTREIAAFGELVACSHVMKDVFSRLLRLAKRDTTLFIEGESGTGKELAARAVHLASARRLRPFVVVDCSSIPRTLIEAELFGHAKGAFTGATQAQPGKFVAANGGTIFLDEIGELDVDLQPRLLRVLERREVCPVGGTAPVPIDVRFISATNRNLRQAMRRGTFREDLFYRLAVASVTLPPLRERTEDIPILIKAFLAQHAAHDGEPYQLHDATIRRMCARPWPGNVRELRNAVEELVVFGEPGQAFEDGYPPQPGGAPAGDELGLFKEEKARVIDAFEEHYLSRLLVRHENNISASAVAAGLDRVHLLRLLYKHGLRLRDAERNR